MKKVGQFLACFLPFIIFLVIQFIVTLVVEVGVIVKYFAENGGFGDDYLDFIIGLATDTDFLLKVTVSFQIVALIVGAILYYFAFKEKNIENPLKVVGGPGALYIICAFVGVEFFVGFLLQLLFVVAPEIMESYQKLIEQSGLGDMTLFSTIATLVMAPLAEELYFRGMTFKFARKFTSNFWVANCIQAAIFGLAHMNLVQGVYAFVLGLTLGYIYKKFNSLYASMLAHLTFNFAGTYINNWVYGNAGENENMIMWITTGIAVVLIVVFFFLIINDKKAREREQLFDGRYRMEYAMANAAPAPQPMYMPDGTVVPPVAQMPQDPNMMPQGNDAVFTGENRNENKEQ